MKRGLLILLSIALSNCANTMSMMGMEDSICTNRPPEFTISKSHICEVSAALNIPPEEVDNLLLDASAMAYVTDQTNRKKVGQFLTVVENYLGPICSNITYDTLLTNIKLDAENSALLMRVLNRHLRLYGSPETISDFDCWMIRVAIQHQREQFGLPF
jgi:hypothetical protein